MRKSNSFPVSFSYLSKRMDIYYKRLFDGNRQWVKEKLAADPDYFKKLSLGQSPPALWIGCSDSRVPANEITNTQPGEIFVHRNIANVIDPTDMNLLSVIDFAVKVLKVQHIIVAGHYQCSGIKAALSNVHYGLIDNWLRNIKDVYRLHQKELDTISDPVQRENRLVELNVMEGVFSICKTSTVQSAWENKQPLHVHGWVIDINTGLLKDLNVTVRDSSEILDIYKFDF